MSKQANRSSYTSKNISQRSAYQKYIRTTERQPTVDENFDFDSTLQQGEELSEPTSKRKRSIPTTKKIENYFKQHWIEWVIGVFILISVYFFIDAKINIAVLEVNFTSQKELTDKIELTLDKKDSYQSQKNDNIDSSIDILAKENSSQDLIINEIKIRLGFLEDKINSVRVTPGGQP